MWIKPEFNINNSLSDITNPSDFILSSSNGGNFNPSLSSSNNGNHNNKDKRKGKIGKDGFVRDQKEEKGKGNDTNKSCTLKEKEKESNSEEEEKEEDSFKNISTDDMLSPSLSHQASWGGRGNARVKSTKPARGVNPHLISKLNSTLNALTLNLQST